MPMPESSVAPIGEIADKVIIISSKGLSKNVVSGLGRRLNLYAEEAHEGYTHKGAQDKGDADSA